MAGHYPSNAFGPPQQPQVPGPFGVVGKVLCCLLPLATAGLLGFVPALLLAARRKRPSDVAVAVLFVLLSGVMMVCLVVAAHDKHGPANGIGATAMVLMVFAPPVHFLLMDRRAVWARAVGGPTSPAPAFPYVPPQPPLAQPQLQPYATPQAPLPQAPLPQPPADDLQQLGELLRRQAGGESR